MRSGTSPDGTPAHGSAGSFGATVTSKMRASLANTNSTASDTATGVFIAPEATARSAHRAMCGSALMSKLVPVPASSVGPTKTRMNPTSVCSSRSVSTMRLSAALVAVYTPMPGQAGPMLETDDR